MKRMVFSLMAMVCVLTLSAQSVYDNEVINSIMARRSIVCTPANGGGELDAGLLGENIMLFLINGSPRTDGNTFCCLQEIETTLQKHKRTLATNMAFLLQKIHADGDSTPKRDERPQFMNFIR